MEVQAYHFTSDVLRDGRPLPAVGEWLQHDGPVKYGDSGLHASRSPLDAALQAPGPFLHGVTCDDIREDYNEVFVCSRRRIDWTLDAEAMLRAFMRRCALQVAPEWEAPPVVISFLQKGNESERAHACGASKEVDSANAYNSWKGNVRSAARIAAQPVARTGVGTAAWGVAWAALRSRAWKNAREEQRAWLLTMIEEARAGKTEWVFE